MSYGTLAAAVAAPTVECIHAPKHVASSRIVYIVSIWVRAQYLMSYSTVQYGTVRYATVMYGTVLYDAVRYGAIVLYGTS